jgi:hypothetical protein
VAYFLLIIAKTRQKNEILKEKGQKADQTSPTGPFFFATTTNQTTQLHRLHLEVTYQKSQGKPERPIRTTRRQIIAFTRRRITAF